jgi:hypothetical protein
MKHNQKDCKKNIVFIGEAGCGKTEAAINYAVALSASGMPVHFFDMDQTKPLFRARDSAKIMEAAGVIVHYQEQLLDLPTLVPAVNETLADEGVCVIMDVGGSVQGARMIGQFSTRLNGGDAETIFIINPYRPWTNDQAGIEGATARIMRESRIQNVRIVCNPTLGLDTSADEAVLGSSLLTELLGTSPDFTLARAEIADEVAKRVPEPVLPLHIYIRYPWQV